MAQTFHRRANTVFLVSLIALVLVVGGLDRPRLRAAGFDVRHPRLRGASSSRSSSATSATSRGNGIDCRYCHTSVETSAFAGIPPTKTCMNCHSQIFSNSPFLEPVRASFRTGESIQWTRVHDLPDFVYFNHSIHVAKGVGCSTCHGRVDRMPLMFQVAVAADGVVPRLPPEPRAVRPPARSRLPDGLRAAGRSARARAASWSPSTRFRS